MGMGFGAKFRTRVTGVKTPNYLHRYKHSDFVCVPAGRRDLKAL